MSNHEKASAVGMPTNPASRMTDKGKVPSTSSSHPISRQQLPSLSSLFGPPSSAPPSVPPLRSPPAYGATHVSHSPLERPRVLPGGGGSLHAYFSQTLLPRVAQPRSSGGGGGASSSNSSANDAKLDSDRQSLPSLVFSALQSPSSNPHNQSHGRPICQSDGELSSSWSVQQESRRQEYSVASRDSTIHYPRDRGLGHENFNGSRDACLDSSAQKLASITVNPPPTPTSTVVSEGVPSKDGLGPKIWTGTHFLPRFVKAAEVPGEGMCYFYDDGSHCKTVIDGEAVNAHWGVTKAGKPRKRLAIACVTCREKKIKCDPDYPRCVQCEKFGRVCRFKNAPRGGHNTSPSTPPAELDDRRKLTGPPRHGDYLISESESSPPTSPRLGLSRTSPSSSGFFSKRLKVGPETYRESGEPSRLTARSLDHAKVKISSPRRPEVLPRISDEILRRAWATDPYGSDPESINAVLTQYFGQIDNTMILQFLPEKIFRCWVSNPARAKTPEDLMVLYSALPIGVALSGGPKAIAYEYAQVAYYAQRMTSFPCLQLVQSRILLAVYHISASRLQEAGELISSAAAAAACLQLNQELEAPRPVESSATYPFGMNHLGYREARRRTLWSLFLLERLNTVFPNRPAMINAEDIYVRLPADSETFERQADAFMPLFDPDEPMNAKLTDKASEITSYLVEMAHIWWTCQAGIFRLASRSARSDADLARTQYVRKRAEDWSSSLPSRLTFCGSNLESAACSGKAGPFLTMHLLHHHAIIRLNRHHVSMTGLSDKARADHVRVCCEHAASILDIASCLDRILRVRPMTLLTVPPAMSVAVLTAVDVLTAGGDLASISELSQRIRAAKMAVDGTAKVWEHSAVDQEAIEQRLQMLMRIFRSQGTQLTASADGYRIFPTAHGAHEEGQFRWQMMEPMEKPYLVDIDIMYSNFP